MNTDLEKLLNAMIRVFSIYVTFLVCTFSILEIFLPQLVNVQGVLVNMKIIYHVSNKND